MDDLLNDFLAETAEQIEAAGLQLVLLERDPTNAAIISSIFRLVHTIKGTCGFLGLARLERLTHAAETLMGRLRDGTPATSDAVTLILATVDRIKFILAGLESHASEPEGEDHDLIAALNEQVDQVSSQGHAAQDAAPRDPARPAPAFVPPSAAPDATAADVPAPAILDQRRPETIRVAVGALERIMILVSELVLTRNQLLEVTRRQDDEILKAPLQRLSSLTTDLQDAVMRARMQPVGRLFSSLPRLVRELSVELNKKLRLVTDGADTEIDRQLIERIRDPLTHMVRNCADHGIEPPEERKAAGKPEAGLIQVAASHEAGYITIEVIDDGRGLDLDRIRAKVLTKGLVTPAELDRMSDDEVSRFIFAPNFSTASAVTNISGRGVGMDVVRDNIESIGGTVSLTTTPGKGSRFSLRIPLTLAIAPALIVEVGQHRFALPQHSVVEVVGLENGSTTHKIERVQGSLVLRLRDEVLPVVDLGELLGLERGAESSQAASLAMIMRVGNLAFGILVDGVADVQEIVVKPLGASLSDLAQFSGHTILGDGSVVLILDPTGIAHSLGLEEVSEHAVRREATSFVPSSEMTRLVLFRSGPGILKAIPLSLIARIETVDVGEIASSDGELVMRHQGHLMPLVRVSPETASDRTEQPILVLSIGGESMGLVIDEIIDIVEENLDIEIAGAGARVVGTAQIRDRVVEILDATHFMRLGRPKAFARGFTKRFNVLLVDDKLFFRDMLAPLLKAVGYAVTTAASGEEALALFERGARFDAVVTDTDMPGMNGYDLARALRADPRRANLPVVALAAHAAPAVVQAATACGMCAAVGKFDRAALLEALGLVLDAQELNDHDLERRVMTGRAA